MGIAEQGWASSDMRVSVSALSLISCVSLSMLLRLSEPCLIPRLSAGGDRIFP